MKKPDERERQKDLELRWRDEEEYSLRDAALVLLLLSGVIVMLVTAMFIF